MNLSRHNNKYMSNPTPKGAREGLDAMWVVGPHGAVTTRFIVCYWPDEFQSSIMTWGHDTEGKRFSVMCDGYAWHWPAHRPTPPELDDCTPCYHESCQFLETRCHYAMGSTLNHDDVEHYYVDNKIELVFEALEQQYSALFLEHTVE